MTRDEWIKLWNAIKRIEDRAGKWSNHQNDINIIKDLIENEIGQME